MRTRGVHAPHPPAIGWRGLLPVALAQRDEGLIMAALVLCLGCAGRAMGESQRRASPETCYVIQESKVKAFRCQRCATVFCEHGIGWPKKGFELCFACKAREPRVPEDIDGGQLRKEPLTPEQAAAAIEAVRPK